MLRDQRWLSNTPPNGLPLHPQITLILGAGMLLGHAGVGASSPASWASVLSSMFHYLLL